MAGSKNGGVVLRGSATGTFSLTRGHITALKVEVDPRGLGQLYVYFYLIDELHRIYTYKGHCSFLRPPLLYEETSLSPRTC